jgi:electron transfer flavoprotein beta subunit
VKIVVLVKQVPDTWGERTLDSSTGWVNRDGENVIDEINERALEVALSLKDADKSAEVIAMTMAPDNVADSLKKALAMGCDSAIHVSDPALAGADASVTAAVLSAAIRTVNPDLVIAGNESTDGRGGLVPSMIAEHLKIGHLGMLASIDVSSSSVSGIRLLEDGTQEVTCSLPAVISVNESNPDARFPSFKGIMGAKKKPVTVLTCSDLGIDVTSATTVLSSSARPPRQAGTKIVDDGTAATQLADYLTFHRLI